MADGIAITRRKVAPSLVGVPSPFRADGRSPAQTLFPLVHCDLGQHMEVFQRRLIQDRPPRADRDLYGSHWHSADEPTTDVFPDLAFVQDFNRLLAAHLVAVFIDDHRIDVVRVHWCLAQVRCSLRVPLPDVNRAEVADAEGRLAGDIVVLIEDQQQAFVDCTAVEIGRLIRERLRDLIPEPS